MKLKLHLLLLALCAFVFLPSCDNDDDNIPSAITETTRSAFKAKYPNVSNEHWEVKRNYHVAEFYENGREVDVWFSTDGVWQMTETDLGKNASLLPAAVQSALTSSTYGTWTIDDIDFYERLNDSFYLVEVETKGQRDHDLFFAPDGSLLKAVEDIDNDDVLPSTVL